MLYNVFRGLDRTYLFNTCPLVYLLTIQNIPLGLSSCLCSLRKILCTLQDTTSGTALRVLYRQQLLTLVSTIFTLDFLTLFQMPSSDSIPYNLLNSNDELGMVYSRNLDSNSIKYLYPGCFVCSGLFFHRLLQNLDSYKTAFSANLHYATHLCQLHKYAFASLNSSTLEDFSCSFFQKTPFCLKSGSSTSK